jgi:mannose-6-phosphate isomerase-like protein (cupin superfamily)
MTSWRSRRPASFGDHPRQRKREIAMTSSAPPLGTDPVTLEAARAAPIPAGQRSAPVMAHGSMLVKFYRPRGHDPQTPHDQDELYVVARGTGVFLRAGERHRFQPGDMLFAAAGETHRFEEFTDDFETWVIFYGPKGGE